LIRLLDHIECKYLSVEGISNFISLISNEPMSSLVWSSLCRRLELPVSVPPDPRGPRLIDLDLDRDRPFEGVFAYLGRQCGKNPQDAGLIAISADDVASGYKDYDLLSEGRLFASGGTAVDHYVKIDLKEIGLVPSGYSVKTHGSPANGINFVRSWRFEGSNDDSEWEVLDNHTNSDELMGNNKEVSFMISTTTQFRFLRFIMTGVNSSGYGHLFLQRLEIFGHLQSIP
jgi:hypothetical protein